MQFYLMIIQELMWLKALALTPIKEGKPTKNLVKMFSYAHKYLFTNSYECTSSWCMHAPLHKHVDVCMYLSMKCTLYTCTSLDKLKNHEAYFKNKANNTCKSNSLWFSFVKGPVIFGVTVSMLWKLINVDTNQGHTQGSASFVHTHPPAKTGAFNILLGQC